MPEEPKKARVFPIEECSIPDFSKNEIVELCRLDAVCFPEPINYPYAEMRRFLRQDGAMLLRIREGGQGKPGERKLVGFCLSNWRSGQLITIDVDPDFHGKGIGRQLMEETIRILKQKGCRRMFSNVALNNLPSLRLHLRSGFKIRHIIPNYYADGASAYLLALGLGDVSKKPK